MVAGPNRAADDGSCLGAVAIVASAGGISALIELLGGLEGTFPLPIYVAQHLPRIDSKLDLILSQKCSLPVRWARGGKQDRSNGVHLACPGTSIRLTADGIAIDRLALPPSSWLASGDRMIQSVLSVFASRTVAIVLSGMLPAGVEGIRAVRRIGGITMAQDRRSSASFDMPSAAIDFGKAEIVCSPRRMAQMLSLIAEGWQDVSAELSGVSGATAARPASTPRPASTH
jgi:two-component system, chemotaxis family, protein-glutamate methylesterase/glutaminase